MVCAPLYLGGVGALRGDVGGGVQGASHGHSHVLAHSLLASVHHHRLRLLYFLNPTDENKFFNNQLLN